MTHPAFTLKLTQQPERRLGDTDVTQRSLALSPVSVEDSTRSRILGSQLGDRAAGAPSCHRRKWRTFRVPEPRSTVADSTLAIFGPAR